MDELSVQDLSDEDIAKLVELGMIPDQQAQLAKQMEQARQLQNPQMPGMRGNSRVQVAASPLEYIAPVVGAIRGRRQEKDLQSQMDALRKQQLQGRQLYANRAMDSPYRRSTQPFIQQVGTGEQNVPMPNMGY
jgi:hypothetical protein